MGPIGPLGALGAPISIDFCFCKCCSIFGRKKSPCGQQQSSGKLRFGRFGPHGAPWAHIRALWALFRSIPSLLRPLWAPMGPIWAPMGPYMFLYIFYIISGP